MKGIMQRLTPLWATNFTLPGIVVAIISLLTPIAAMLHTVLFLILVDNITGIMAHFKSHNHKFVFWRWSSWRHIKSKKLGSSINKSLVYMLLIISGFVLDKFIISTDAIYIANIFAGAVSFREVKSILENVEIVSGGNLIKTIRTFFKHGIKGGIEKMLDTEESPTDKKQESSKDEDI